MAGFVLDLWIIYTMKQVSFQPKEYKKSFWPSLFGLTCSMPTEPIPHITHAQQCYKSLLTIKQQTSLSLSPSPCAKQNGNSLYALALFFFFLKLYGMRDFILRRKREISLNQILITWISGNIQQGERGIGERVRGETEEEDVLKLPSPSPSPSPPSQ